MTTLILLRHGRSSANVAGVLAGRTPGVELDETGRTQAQKVVERLAGVPIAEIEAAAPGTPIARSVLGITELLQRAQLAGEIRADLTLADLAMLLAAVPGAEVSPVLRARFVDIVIAGLAASPHT